MSYLTSPVAIFLIALGAGEAFYLLSQRLSPPSNPSGAKLRAYIGVEADYPATKLVQSFNFFHVAFLFTIVHIGILIIATVPSGSIAWVGALYVLGIALSVAALLSAGGDAR